MRIAYISNHPAPYRDAFLNRLVRTSGLEVSVFSMFPNDSGHAFWNLKTPDYDAPVLAQYSESRLKLLWRLLRGFVFTRKYDFVFWPGIFCFYLKIPILLCSLFGKAYAFSADSVKQPPISRVGFWIKRYIVRHAAFIFVPGEASVNFFTTTFGIPRNKIIKGAYALDGVSLENKIDLLRKDRRAIRNRLGLMDSDVVFLMVANMIKTRHYPVTGAAFIRFAGKFPKAKFVMVGKGPEAELMENMAKKHDCLRVIPGCSFDAMLELYACADVYIHGGTEPASTALVIGAIAELPLISSPAVGCYYDVVRDGETGFAVADYLDEEQWRKTFERCMMKSADWSNMGKRGHELSRGLDIDAAVADFIAAAERSCQ